MSIGRIMRMAPVVLLTAGSLVLAGCGDDDEGGPGSFDGTVSSTTPLGAVVLLVEGGGIDAIEGTGGTREFVGPVSGTTRRVLLVGAGELTFEIATEDTSERPTVVVQGAVDTSNQDIPSLNGIDVDLRSR